MDQWTNPKPFLAKNREATRREIYQHVAELYSEALAEQRLQHALPPAERESYYNSPNNLTARICGIDLDLSDPDLPASLAAAEAAEAEYQAGNPHPRVRPGEDGYEQYRAHRFSPDRPMKLWRVAETERRLARLTWEDSEAD